MERLRRIFASQKVKASDCHTCGEHVGTSKIYISPSFPEPRSSNCQSSYQGQGVQGCVRVVIGGHGGRGCDQGHGIGVNNSDRYCPHPPGTGESH